MVSTLMMQLVRRPGESAIVRADLPIRLDDFNEPEPDFALVRPRPDGYARMEAMPAGADIAPQALPGVRLRLADILG